MIKIVILLKKEDCFIVRYIYIYICYLGSEVRTYRDANVEWTEMSDSDAAWESTITAMREGIPRNGDEGKSEIEESDG